MITDDNYFMNNLAEEEFGQLHAIHINLNAVAGVRRHLADQARMKSQTHCCECGEEIPLARRAAIPGVQLCVHCKANSELSK